MPQKQTQYPEPEATPSAPRRRQFSAEYKLRVLAEADSCTQHGEIGALLRREGLYSSYLTTWRRQRDEGLLQELDERHAADVAQLRRENEQLQARVQQAETIIGVQKNALKRLGLSVEPGSERDDRAG
jgi:transposase